MKGEFVKSARIYAWLYLVMGSVMAVLFGTLLIDELGGNREEEGLILCSGFCLLGILIGLGALFSLKKYKSAYLTLTPTNLHARYGWGKEITVNYADIEVLGAMGNTLRIVTASGKAFLIPMLSNATALCQYIASTELYRSKPLKEVDEAELHAIEQKWKRYLIVVFILCGLAFVWIFFAVLLTGGKDIPDFDAREDGIFCVFIGIEVLNMILMLLLAVPAGKLKRMRDDMYFCRTAFERREKWKHFKDDICVRHPSAVKVFVSESAESCVVFYTGEISGQYRFVLESFSLHMGVISSFESGFYDELSKAERAAWEMLGEDASEECDVISFE